MRFSTVHIQTTVGPEYLATITNALHEMGREPRSVSDMAAMALEMLSDILVESGYTAIVEPLVIEEVLSSLRQGRRRRPGVQLVVTKSIAPKIDPFGAIAQQQAMEIHNSGRYRKGEHSSRLTVLPSVADEGEFSAEALREEENG